MKRLVWHRLVTVLALLAVIAAMCGTPAAALAGPKVLKLRLTEEPSNLDPAFHVGYSDTEPATTIMEGLVAFKPGGYDVVNVLAESIEQSADGLRIDFKLREGVQFHKEYGELTAEDVKFSYERYLDKDLASPYAGDWVALDHVEVSGKYAGSIVLKQPFVPLFAGTLPIFSGMIVFKAAMEKLGKEQFALNPVGTGPYELAEFVPNQRLTVKRFDGYWGEPPEWDEIQFLPIVEDSAAEIALETGEIDYGRISAPAAARFEANDSYQVVALPSLSHHGLAMNVQHPKLQDINVRQAIRYAIDAPSIVEAAYSGAAARACTILSPASPAYWVDAPCHDRDLEKARNYMAQAGLESLDLTLTIINSPIPRIAAEVIQANLADIGIKLEIESLDSAAYWEGGFGDAGIQNRELTWITYDAVSADPYWAIQWWTCAQIGQYNFSYWCNKKFDELFNAALEEYDSNKRLEMYYQMLQIWDDDVAIVWVAHPIQYFAGRADLVPAQSPMGVVVAQGFHTK